MFDPVILRYQLKDAALYWVVIPAAVLASGRAVDLLFGLPPLTPPLSLKIGALLLLVTGLVLIALSMRELAAAGGTPNPRRPPRKMVTSGIYAVCRHPMFLGYDLCALAVVLLLGSPAALLISLPVFIMLQVRFLRREERILMGRFKQAFADYADRTPFLLPFPFRRQLSERQSREK